MKKLVYLLLAFIVLSCSQSNEDKIKKAFKEYAKNNLDDPSQLTGIVSIDSLDTISTYTIKGALKEKHEAYKVVDSIYHSINDKMNLYFNDKRYRPKIIYISGLEGLLREGYELLRYRGTILEKMYDAPDSILNEIMAIKDTVVLQQKLTYRLKEKDGLKLHSCYVYSDTLYNDIIFKKEIIKINESPFADLIEHVNEYEAQFNPLYKVNTMLVENGRKTLRLLEREFGEYK